MSTMKIIKRGMKPKYDVSPRSDAPFISEAEIAAMLDELRKDPEATIQRYTEYLGESSKTLPEKTRADISEMQRGDIEYLRETLAIEDPDGGDYLGTVQIADQCVVTSGGYQRYFEQDGVRYWHILDPETGKPARSGMRSVTIVSADDTLADALSTALFVMGPERAEEFWRVHRAEFGAVWLTDDGRLFVTEGLTLTTEREYEVVS